MAAESTPKRAINLGQSLSQPAADSSLYTREPLGTGDADCRVGPAGLLAMTSVFCHSEERSDVGIRPFYDGRGFGPPYLGHGLRRPNSVPKFGASVRSSAPTEGLPKSLQWADVGIGPYGKPDQPPKPAGAQRSVRARGREGWARIGAEAIKKGHSPATTQAALSEAESAGIIAGQIRFLPDAPRVQHGVQGSEVCGKPRPCSRRDCVN